MPGLLANGHVLGPWETLAALAVLACIGVLIHYGDKYFGR